LTRKVVGVSGFPCRSQEKHVHTPLKCLNIRDSQNRYRKEDCLATMSTKLN
jgi:hypothetical protein